NRSTVPRESGLKMIRLGLLTFALLFIGVLRAAEPDKPAVPPYSPELVKEVLTAARERGNARRGALVFGSQTLACLSCHKLAGTGGTVGPDLTLVGKCLPPEEIVESLLWPKRKVKPEFVAIRVTTTDGKSIQGYVKSESARELALLEPGTDKVHRVAKDKID